MQKHQTIYLFDQISNQVVNTSALEWIAFIFGVAQVLLALKNKVLNFYAGIISVCLYIILFYQSGLFAESLLNIYYLIISVAGIVIWNGRSTLPISKTSLSQWLKAFFIFLTLFSFLYLILNHFTESTVPLADSLVATFAWVGSWMLVRRKLENWIILNISNMLAIPLLIYKGLELTAILTLIYFVVAIFGYYTWKRQYLDTGTSFHNS